MLASKMHRLLEYFSTGDWWIGCTGGGELTFEFSSQLRIEDHAYLLKKGFIFIAGPEGPYCYIYRPRKSTRLRDKGRKP